MPLPFPGKDAVPFTPLTAQFLDEMIANDEALAAGTGLNTGAVTAVKTAFGGNYTTTEVDTGFTWVDGKTIYKKTISCGALPNATTKNVAHGVSFSYIISAGGAARAANGTTLPLPYSHPVATSNVSVAVTATNIELFTGSDRTAFTLSYVTLTYTKP